MFVIISDEASFLPAKCVPVCEVVCSRSVLLCFSTCFGAGDIVDDELPCLDGRSVVISCTADGTTCMSCSDGGALQDSNSDLTTLVGIGFGLGTGHHSVVLQDVYVVDRNYSDSVRDQLIVNLLVSTLGNNQGSHTIIGIQGCYSPDLVEHFD